MNLQKGYTRIIGIFFILIIISLIMDYISFGFRPESMHKIFHVLLGIFVVYYGWNNKKFWKPFCIINGLFFTFVALFGWIYPNFGALDAFNLVDTILHTIVGLTGLGIGLIKK
jgi:hypothetical protein